MPTGFEDMPIVKDKSLWWLLEGEELGAQVSAIGEQLWEADSPRRVEIEKNLRRFGGTSMRGLFQGRMPAPDADNARINITKAVTETLTAKVGSNRARPKVLTTGGNHSLRIRAKKLQRFLDGAYKQARVYGLTPLVFRDALLCGTGVTYFYPNIGKKTVEAERVFPPEILVDDMEAVNGNPQTLFRVKFIDKGKLAGMFPKKAREIEDLATVSQDELPDLAIDQEEYRGNRMVRVFEAWHLAIYADDGTLVKGKRVLAASKLLLGEDEWAEDFFPFEFFHWSAPVRGFWGDSAVAEIRGLEKEVNTLLQKVQKAMRLAGQPWVLNPRGAKVKPAKITNETALIVDYDGPTPPTVVTFTPVSPQIIEQMWTLHSKAYAQLGTNELQAAAIKPPGIDSGRGLEQLSEEHLVRFKHVSKAFEDMVGSAFARQLVRCARELDERLRARGDKNGYVIRATANKTSIQIKWSDAQIDPDDFFLETWPTSVLPLTPSGKTEEVERWQQNGWITKDRAQTLLEFPDLDSETNLTTADSELLEWQLEKMLDDGDDIVPEPRQNLQNAMQRGTFALEKGMQDGTPEENLDKLRTFLNACDELMQPPAPAPVPPGMPPMGAPPGMPMPAAALGPASPQGLPGMSPGMPPA